ncbi:MAG: dihydroorotase [Candidatus Obscuribacterales bacterium]|nr:dihydroorotase [Cyanobacteria bacterium HKST-UBA01]MCB9467401.1 dihydroorotase [Candidatus Obscuribacterales bacterium]
METLEIRRPDDMHVHFRQGKMLESVMPYTARQCARALVMPNTTPPILTASELIAYRDEIQSACKKENIAGFEPLMTFKVAPATDVDEIKRLKEAGAVAGKLYPEGVTTNSADGVRDFKAIYPVYQAMQDEGLILCIHGEVPGVFSLDRERAFLSTLKELASDFPRLKIILEHATTKDAVDAVLSLPETIACTLTVHHLYLTLDDVIGGMLDPHVFCKPVAKLPSDREALLEAAFSGNPKFFLGSDSAPHTVDNKECPCGAAGVYTAPVMMPALIDLFDKHGKLNRLEAFVSEFGARFYGLPLNEGKDRFVKKDWTVPDICGEVKPFLYGKTLGWQAEAKN